MKPLSRRSVTAGLAAAVTAIPAVGLSVAAKGAPRETIKHLTGELEKAMLECHPGSEIVTVAQEKDERSNPFVFVAAKPGAQS